MEHSSVTKKTFQENLIVARTKGVNTKVNIKEIIAIPYIYLLSLKPKNEKKQLFFNA